jgi:murein DD-endopeptidase MepM/ murein hydrolase activator NlpD
MNAQQRDRYQRSKGSPLAGQGAAFVRAGRRHRVPAKLLVAITGAESSFGKHLSGSNNPFGWGPGIDFGSWGEAIDTVASGLRENYLNAGLRSIPQIGGKYAPKGAGNDPTNLNSHWVTNVQKFFSELGGGKLGSSGGPVSNAPTSPSVPASSSAPPPDFSAVAFGNLGSIAQGRFDPLESLTSLTQAMAATRGTSTPTTPESHDGHDHAQPATSTGTTSGGITYSGQPLTHPTSGLAGYPAVDLFADPGTPFLAPENGRVVRHSGRGGTTGGFYGWSVYFQGDSGRKYYVQHLNRKRATGRVRKGQPLGTISPWEGGDPHAHVGIKGG